MDLVTMQLLREAAGSALPICMDTKTGMIVVPDCANMAVSLPPRTGRHSVKKSDDRRAEIIDKLADYVLAEGLSASSLRPLAEAVGTSDRMLLYYFRDKAELISAVLERISARFAAHLQSALAGRPLAYEALRGKVLKIVLAREAWPYMSVWLEIAARAARGDPFYRAVGEQLATGFLAFTEARLAVPGRRRRAEALRLLTDVEGTMLLAALGLADASRKSL